jgi:hypothetical protein
MATFPTTLQVLGMQLKTDGNHPTDAMDIVNCDSGRVINKGLTKREYFAALMMQAIVTRTTDDGYDSCALAEEAVDYADSLINALNADK